MKKREMDGLAFFPRNTVSRDVRLYCCKRDRLCDWVLQSVKSCACDLLSMCEKA